MTPAEFARKAYHKIRRHIVFPVQQQIDSITAVTIKELHEKIAALEAKLNTTTALVTEHPMAAARGLAKAHLPSPAVSVIMPLWNRGAVVSDAIQSVLRQSFTDWELLVVDDGSADNSAEVVRSFADPRIRLISQEHAGASAARNRGLKEAKGAVIAYLDSDNIWYPEFLGAGVAVFAAEPEVDSLYGALVSEAHGDHRVLFDAFDRAKLLKGNFIDLNVFMHRKALFEQQGGFDESLLRLNDWDLVLRYTQEHPPRALSVLAARYRVVDDKRLTATSLAGPPLLSIARKWNAAFKGPTPRVLYALYHYPHISETYIDTEILAMQRRGVHIEAWAESDAVSPCETGIMVHRGTFEEAVKASRPDIIHVHWLDVAWRFKEFLHSAGVPVTVRAHGFDARSPEALKHNLTIPAVRGVFCFPVSTYGLDLPGLYPMNPGFNSAAIAPAADKDRKLVVRTSSCLPSKDLALFFDLANRMPDYRFVMAIVSCIPAYTEELKQIWKDKGSPGELHVNLSHSEALKLVSKAGIYLHTISPPNDPNYTTIGMPISISEAMATGCYTLVRDEPALKTYIGPVGATYNTLEEAEALIRATARWSDAQWRQVQETTSNHSFGNYADDIALRPLFELWCRLYAERQVPLRFAA